MVKTQILNELLQILTKYLKVNVKFGEDYDADRRLFRGLTNQCLTLIGIDEKFYTLQDKLLSMERDEKGVVDVESFKYENNIALYQGDITRLKADAIVNAANDDYLGCFIPNHDCIDNVIMSASGFQMRNELYKLKFDKTYTLQSVRVSYGYNLPCKYVFHVAGPQAFGRITNKEEQELANCYINCLNKAKEMKLKSIVFCCISTGVYSFPIILAAKIAVQTVKRWQRENDYDIKIVFDVFKDLDKELYELRLQTESCYSKMSH